MNEKFVEEWEKAYYRKAGAKKVSGEFFDFKGKSAYKATDEEIIDGVRSCGVVILWLEDDRLFEILALRDDGDPLKDQGIQAFVESVKFLPKSEK
jgi:hypothetical protein